MDATGSRSRLFGHPATTRHNNIPSFTTYFSSNDATDSASTPGRAKFSKILAKTSWNKYLAVPKVLHRLPAWCRVATQPHSSNRLTSTIMKRVGLLSRHNIGTMGAKPFILHSELESDRKEATQSEVALGRQKRHRSPTYHAAEGDSTVTGYPLSTAEIMSMLMHARVDVANCMLAHQTSNSLADLRQCRIGHYVQSLPMKRRFDVDYFPNSNDLQGGNCLRTYVEITPILDKATEIGLEEVDVKTASIAHSAAILQEIRRDPRQRLAPYGIPELSDIHDITEPDSSYALMLPPGPKAEAKSPTKRLARVTSPAIVSPSRISETKITLLPGSTPNAEPSPTKSSSVPSTPLKDASSPLQLLQTPSLAPPGSFSLHSAPDKVSPTKAQSGTARTFTASLSLYSTSLIVQGDDLSNLPNASALDVSPAKLTSRDEPTPLNESLADPSTPFRTQTQTPGGEASSHLGLVASIPPSTPRLPPSSWNDSLAKSISTFDFGVTSPSFNAVPWLLDATDKGERERVQNTKQSRRRKSEPLIRHHLRTKAQRQTISPQRLYKNAERATDYTIAEYTFTPLRPSNGAVTSTSPNKLTPTSAGRESGAVARHVAFADTVEKSSDEKVPALGSSSSATDENSKSTQTIQRGVFNIDMHQNQDIFGSHMSSLSRSPAIHELARIAEHRCDGQANVIVEEQSDRLVVRFKLPTDYAGIFQDSQGVDESHFTTSPSAVSSSPRLRFPGPPLSAVNFETLSSSPIKYVGTSSATSSPAAAAEDCTLPVPDFAVSPLLTRETLLRQETGTSPSINDGRADIEDIEGSSTMSFPSLVVADQDITIPGLELMDFERMAESSPASQPATTQKKQQHHKVAQQLAEPTTPHSEDTHARSISSRLDRTAKTGGSGITATSDEKKSDGPSDKASSHCIKPNMTFSQPFQADSTTKPNPSHATRGLQETRTGALLGDAETAPMPPQGNDHARPNEPATGATPTSSPTLNTSFTPVNRTSSARPVFSTTDADDEVGTLRSTDTPKDKESGAAKQDYDSPGRAYMREFIKRSKPKRLSTTETGSPIQNTGKRQPLGAKSPNVDSPEKAKRPLENDDGELQSPLKKGLEPEPKRVRRTGKGPGRPRGSTRPKGSAEPNSVDAAANMMEKADSHEDDAEMENAPLARRSSRLKGHDNDAAPRSSIPTPIKLNRPGIGHGVLSSAVRNEQQELIHQTRKNTRKNKGNAEYPAQFLARSQEEVHEDEAALGSAAFATTSKTKKIVGWSEPLAVFQEEKPAKRKPGPKPKVTQERSGIAKPTRIGAAAQKQRTAKLAETLGMAGNGTPAKPQRMTRSRTRTKA